jgi:putative redox protein
MHMPVTIDALPKEPYRHIITANGHTFFADIPTEKGGQNTAPDPHQLLFGAWGACTAMTIQMYARRKGWPLEDVRITFEEEHRPGKKPIIKKCIRIAGPNLSEEQVRKLERIAEKCPVNQLITGEKQVEKDFSCSTAFSR